MKYLLHCDNPDCGRDLPVEDLSEELIGTPCPACGENLLTAEDYALAASIQQTLLNLEALSNALIELSADAGSAITEEMADKVGVRVASHNNAVTVSIDGIGEEK